MHALAALAAFTGAMLSAVSAQTDPNDPLGLGLKRGIQMLNQSGQVGTVTLFRRGESTLVLVDMHGVPQGKLERVAIHRNADCDGGVAPQQAYALHDLAGGRSRTMVGAPLSKLASGNYSVVVRSREQPKHLFACGHLFR